MVRKWNDCDQVVEADSIRNFKSRYDRVYEDRSESDKRLVERLDQELRLNLCNLI